MFDVWMLSIGAAITMVVTVLKITAVVTWGWLIVLLPLLISIGIVLLKHGVDFTDFIPD